MNIEEMDLIIQEGEGYRVEFKERVDSDFSTEVCALANAAGGMILIGVDDKRRIVGTKTSNSELSKIQDIINSMTPRPDTAIEVLDDVVMVRVFEGKSKPYMCSKGFYVRCGPNSQKMGRDEILEFMQSEELIRFDSKVRNRHPIQENFNEKAYKKFIQKAKIPETIPREHVLRNIKCADLNDHGELAYTNAGALFFRDNTEDNHFMNMRVVCVLFKGTGRSMIIDSAHLYGSAMDNIDDAVKFLLKSIRVRHEIRGVQRYNVPEIPEDALREAVTNAVCHRDYFFEGVDIMIEVFDDRVVINNPGGFPKGLNEDTFGTKSVPRNPVIADMLFRSDYIERMGSGIKKIRDAVELAGLEPPIFEVTNFFSVTFKRPPMHMPGVVEEPPNIPLELSENESKICELMVEDKYITITEMVELLGLSKRTIIRIIGSLTERGIIVRVGPNRGGSWKITRL